MADRQRRKKEPHFGNSQLLLEVGGSLSITKAWLVFVDYLLATML